RPVSFSGMSRCPCSRPSRFQSVSPCLMKTMSGNLVASTSKLRSVLDGRYVRRIDRLHADDVVAGIDVVHLAGDGSRQVGEEIEGSVTDLLDGDRAFHRRVQLVPFEDIAEVADPRCR